MTRSTAFRLTAATLMSGAMLFSTAQAAPKCHDRVVYRYHTVKQSFPAVLIAGALGFKEREFFETDQRDPVNVSFAPAT